MVKCWAIFMVSVLIVIIFIWFHAIPILFEILTKRQRSQGNVDIVLGVAR